jgi:Domain of unknown function (DUF4411)
MDIPESSPTLYVIDTCSLIAMTETYPIDVFPGVWSKVEDLVDRNILISVEDVLVELSSKDDDIHKWAKSRGGIFRELDGDIQYSAIEILTSHPNLLDLKNKKSSADPFLIAVARANGGIVVTEEVYSGGPDRPKIPDVCKHYNIDCINLLTMLRNEKLKL